MQFLFFPKYCQTYEKRCVNSYNNSQVHFFLPSKGKERGHKHLPKSQSIKHYQITIIQRRKKITHAQKKNVQNRTKLLRQENQVQFLSQFIIIPTFKQLGLRQKSQGKCAGELKPVFFLLGEFCVSVSDGIYQNPSDCSKFIQCFRGKSFHTSCASGLLFNPKIKACDWPQNVNCA